MKIFNFILICSIFILSATNSTAQSVIKWPNGAATAFTMNASTTTDLTAYNTVTYSTLQTLTDSVTLNVTAGAGLVVGSLLHLRVKTTATEQVVFGTGIDAPTVTGVAGKTWTQSFWYNGSTFVPCGAKIQID